MNLRVTAMTEPGEEPGEVSPWAAQLLQQLSDLDDIVVEPEEAPAPTAAKGLGTATHTMVAHMTGSSALPSFVRFIREWVSRTNRSVEISLDGDVLKLTGASREQQRHLVEAFLARHPVP